MTLLIVVAIIAVIAIWLIVLRNGIVEKDNRCDNAWQTIDVQLQRRADLIPNLVETVKGYAAHESSTLESVTAARSSLTQATTPDERMAANNRLSSTLRSLFAVAESYPDLKANSNFQQLQQELADTETKLGYARQSYNDCVLAYNNAIETFPGSLIAGSRFKERQGFQVEDGGARQAPKVQF